MTQAKVVVVVVVMRVERRKGKKEMKAVRRWRRRYWEDNGNWNTGRLWFPELKVGSASGIVSGAVLEMEVVVRGAMAFRNVDLIKGMVVGDGTLRIVIDAIPQDQSTDTEERGISG